MNGQDSNNQLNQNNLNDGSNPTVLGGLTPDNQTPLPEKTEVNNVPPVNPSLNESTPSFSTGVPPMNEPVMLDNDAQTNPTNEETESSTEAVLQPIPGTNPVNTPTVGLDPNNLNGNSNGFVEPNKVENIGTVPPPKENEKHPMKKVLFVLLILVLIAGVALGVYYYLSISQKSKITITPKNDPTLISIGDKVSTSVVDYVTISGTDSKNCSVDVSKVNSKEAGEYEYTVTCGIEKGKNKEYIGKVKVGDGSAPEVVTNIVYKKVGSTELSVDDFIKSCTDASGCNVEFEGYQEVLEKLATVGGPYEVAIKATDGENNSATINGELYVVPFDFQLYYACSSQSEESEAGPNKTVVDKLAFGRNENNTVAYLNVGRREYKYEFNDEALYKEAVGQKGTTISYNVITGLAKYDDENLILTISTDLPYATLKSEITGNFPTTLSEFDTYYKNKGYSCSPTLE